MAMPTDTREALETLDQRLKLLLPEEYQESYETLEPTPMGSAGLKFDATGKVAWNEIWGSFCDLAMAGGPPHKGSLLAEGSREAIDAEPDRYAEVTNEICRGVMMAAGLDAQPSPVPGWVRVECYGEPMANWLLRAITMENVAVRLREGPMLDLPAAPHFQLMKEIKNVVTVVAKTSHYWLEHMSRTQQRGIAALFAQQAEESPLIEPAAGWRGIDYPNVRAAIWMMRALVASNVLSRREGTTLFVPINPTTDPDGDRVANAVASTHALAVARGLL
jgi:hypothetical protein